MKKHAWTSWDDYFFKICESVAGKSKDPATHVGCVIVGSNREIRSTGFNGFPMGVFDNPEANGVKNLRYERPEKYVWTEHSERNAIYLAARNGTALEGCTIYLTWMPCAECARAIIQSGIKHVRVFRYHTDDEKAYPMFRFDVTIQMFDEARIDYNWMHNEHKPS